jgi:muramoyltetrapeptide carboxypeptidase
VNKLFWIIYFIFISMGCIASTSTLKPYALREGDTVALVAPAFQFEKDKFYEAIKRIQSLGLKPVFEQSIFNQYGYFSGTDKERSEAINKAIRDNTIKAIISLKGGYGTANLLDKIDYKYLQNHPKIIMGRSDLTALLIAVYTKTNLVTFYGPGATAKQSKTTMQYLKNILFKNHKDMVLDNHVFNHPAHTITPGVVKGQLIGGNLSVLVSLIGTPYFPKDWQGKILFLEDVNEDVYVIDRMLGQLKNAGVLGQISGFVFGTCHHCKSEARGSFSLEEILERYIKPLGIPAYSGAMIGHQEDTYTVPIGSISELNANKKLLKLIESPTRE